MLSFVALLFAAEAAVPPDRSGVLPYSLALERRVQPWCPDPCNVLVPFVATYRKGSEVLVFVATRHAFNEHDPTMRAVSWGFAVAKAAVVIVEGFPTAMGEDPPPLVQEAYRHGTAEADAYAKGEGMHAASLALNSSVPFIGGEPTRAQQIEVLGLKGYTPGDMCFAYLVGSLSQGLRSGDLVNASDPKLPTQFARWAKGFSDQYRLQPLSLGEFADRYRSMFGVDYREDSKVVERSEPGTNTLVGRLNQTDMIVRDEHILETIEQQLGARQRVLIVYGGSHWTTLSQALEKRLGKPRIDVFFQ